MNYEFSSDQTALLDAVDKIIARHSAISLTPQRFQYSPVLAQDLTDAGVFDCLPIEELGPVAATAMVVALSRLPFCAELVASCLIAPAALATQSPGPYAVVWPGAEAAPTRFLPVARTLMRIGDVGVETAPLQGTQVETIESPFAYPMGRLHDPNALVWSALPFADAQRLRDLWRTGIAAETVGCLGAGLQSVLDHVRERRQFGRPLGSFQAVQHRLAECAMLIEGARWLVLKAASTGTTLDASMAAGQAQSIATRVSYDLHQFMGAMGLTLEHPLHRWTYRTKLLRSELGGADRQFIAAAEAAWGCDAADAGQTTSLEGPAT